MEEELHCTAVTSSGLSVSPVQEQTLSCSGSEGSRRGLYPHIIGESLPVK